MSNSPVIHVDGQRIEAGWALDRGLQYGDGLFETLRVRSGRARFVALHQLRLSRGLSRLDIHLDEGQLWKEVQDAARELVQGTLKVLVTRGDAVARGYAPGNGKARRVMTCWPEDPLAGLPAKPVAVSLRASLGENALLAGLKHCNRLEQVLGRAELAESRGAFEGLMASSSGALVSGTMSNVFLKLDGQWLTPVLDRCGVDGIARQVALREAAHCGIAVRAARVDFAALARVEEAFLTNARIGALPLSALDGRALESSESIAALRARMESLDE